MSNLIGQRFAYGPSHVKNNLGEVQIISQRTEVMGNRGLIFAAQFISGPLAGHVCDLKVGRNVIGSGNIGLVVYIPPEVAHNG